MAGKYLVADIGGTNTRVGLADDTGLIEATTRRYQNAENASFETVLEAYLQDAQPGELAGACAGAAGPVQQGVAQMTNLDWHIDYNVLQKMTGAKVTDVINDLPAQGLALDDLTEASTRVLKEGTASDGPRLVVGLGTGMNIVPVHRVGGELVAPSCEGGHASLPYRADQAALCDWLKQECGYPSIEVALAGQGIENLYRFHNGTALSAAKIMAEFDAKEPAARAAMADYMALLGAVIGDYALSHLPFGGIYLTGGVSRAIAPHMSALGFEAAMADKGGFSELAGSFPVILIEDDFAALKGCARHLRQLTARAV
ncbi:ROK family protein [Cognatishimia sp. 1_MG-2023]|uniref:glucokinase n=1 Tax=Cognatishimia sp. 1_MG-2023 TaxID=3062642 RepID=UPI0026E3D2E8|nr:ROK family protein [Cognatishimia sp. 1_MG-2023]MDO6727834.1 ROK family protein [Cognatishimia sp. 1_MG-2023]